MRRGKESRELKILRASAAGIAIHSTDLLPKDTGTGVPNNNNTNDDIIPTSFLSFSFSSSLPRRPVRLIIDDKKEVTPCSCHAK
jgi:hypothetical protein